MAPRKKKIKQEKAASDNGLLIAHAALALSIFAFIGSIAYTLVADAPDNTGELGVVLGEISVQETKPRAGELEAEYEAHLAAFRAHYSEDLIRIAAALEKGDAFSPETRETYHATVEEFSRNLELLTVPQSKQDSYFQLVFETNALLEQLQ